MYCGIIGNVLFPVWFSRYTENAIYYHLEYEWSYLGTMLGIFLLVKSPDDYILAAFLQACTPLICGVFFQ